MQGCYIDLITFGQTTHLGIVVVAVAVVIAVVVVVGVPVVSGQHQIPSMEILLVFLKGGALICPILFKQASAFLPHFPFALV
eukprot:15169324-Ditylum_brightwellii.AAC.1